MARATIHLPVISATTPTRAEAMRECALRAGLSRTKGLSGLILGNPKAWLGTAYHEVLEKIHGVDIRVEPVDVAVERLWTAAIATQHQRMLSHPLDRRFGAPATWPGYYVTKASADLRARNLVGEKATRGSSASEPLTQEMRGPIWEAEFIACEGKLVGRPDLIEDGDVIDYKSGAIVEYDEATQGDVVKQAYVRQLRLYGYLAKEALGNWPRRGILLPAVGEGVEVPLDPAECEAEARQAVALLDDYNAKVAARSPPEAFATPAPSVCKWCSHKLVCSPFWEAATPDWSGRLDGAAIEGLLVEAPQTVQGGLAMAFSIEVDAGSEPRRRARISPLNPMVHDVVQGLGARDRVRVVGLRSRPDGVLVPTARTLIRRVSDIPLVTPGAPT